MFELLSKPKTTRKTITLRLDQVSWLEKHAITVDASFSATIQAVIDIVINKGDDL